MEVDVKRTVAALGSLAAASLLAVTGVLFAPSPASAASLVEVTNFGTNPGNMRMHIYVPDVRPANPAVVVAMHGCGGNGPGFYSGSEFGRLADQYGFVVIYPTATQQAGFGNCFDVWSAASKVRNGGSDPVSIMSMVSYAQRQYGGDPQRVYATGSSSGGMMTQALMALYPDVYKAGAAFMGVPFNCFANAADFPPTNSQCVNGRMDRTPQQWGDAVRQAYPGYTGARPRVQLWHGTNDNLIPFQLLQESVEQWTNVAGLSQNPTRTDTPQASWNRRQFADSTGTVRVEAYAIQGAGHSLPSTGMARAAIDFFGLTSSTPPPTTPPPATGACSATYQVTNSWSGGFQGEVTVTAGSAAIRSWRVTWTYANGQQVSQAWNATLSSSGSTVTATNVSYNGSLGSGASTTFGFLASGSSASAPTLTCTATT
ncbi:esterase [Verrucosispora sp. ts21]|uniref:extracellular catalytic domain type 1 short-chain-length polyhydroxyalkanoate depolymerase n=1 Tax=Verrucosispora sp. ts21 TaxID=2069341 RepID=UPI000C8825B6|nr:PHB depolymerase family esterase [Verrucosispora sp. ts21]PMR61635.1 esterase [Verrucosispora sp. ts21]